MRGKYRALVGASLLLLGGVAIAQSSWPMRALALLEPGLWQIREIGRSSEPPRTICIGDPAVLIQLEHGPASCSRLVVTDSAQVLTVHYTCPAKGYGRTSVRVETPWLAKIDTQGIVGNTPFAYRAEARRLGACTARRSVRR
jgi:hypothetical protein